MAEVFGILERRVIGGLHWDCLLNNVINCCELPDVTLYVARLNGQGDGLLIGKWRDAARQTRLWHVLAHAEGDPALDISEIEVSAQLGQQSVFDLAGAYALRLGGYSSGGLSTEGLAAVLNRLNTFYAVQDERLRGLPEALAADFVFTMCTRISAWLERERSWDAQETSPAGVARIVDALGWGHRLFSELSLLIVGLAERPGGYVLHGASDLTNQLQMPDESGWSPGRVAEALEVLVSFGLLDFSGERDQWTGTLSVNPAHVLRVRLMATVERLSAWRVADQLRQPQDDGGPLPWLLSDLPQLADESRVRMLLGRQGVRHGERFYRSLAVARFAIFLEFLGVSFSSVDENGLDFVLNKTIGVAVGRPLQGPSLMSLVFRDLCDYERPDMIVSEGQPVLHWSERLGDGAVGLLDPNGHFIFCAEGLPRVYQTTALPTLRFAFHASRLLLPHYWRGDLILAPFMGVPPLL